MPDLTKFRIVRAPKKLTETEDHVVRYPEPRDRTQLVARPDLTAGGSVLAGERTAALRRAAMQFSSSTHFVHAGRPSGPGLDGLRQIAFWLESTAGRVTRVELDSHLAEWAHRITAAPVSAETAAATLIALPMWAELRTRVGDSIIALALTKQSPRDLQTLCSWFLVLSFIERTATLTDEQLAQMDIPLWLFRRVIVLPTWVRTEQANVFGSGSIFARQPAFCDFAVIREEWSCFVPAEIAHIENVLEGELKIRKHVRTEETRTTESIESTSSSLEERDNQSTDRSNLQEEVSKQTRLEVGVEGQVDIHAEYGPVEISSSFGASVGYSVDEARRKASEISREVVNRSVSRLEEKVAEARATLRISKVVETNTHTLDNSKDPTGNVVGVYRWVDKISRLQVFTYPHRFVLEFQLPEPAAFVRWLERNRPPVEVDAPPPPPFQTADHRPLTATLVSESNYKELAATFKATGVMPPPEPRIVVSGGVFLKSEDTLPTSVDTPIQFAPSTSAQIDLAVPIEYTAHIARISATGVPLLATWRDQEVMDEAGDSDPHYYKDTLGYHSVTVGVAFGGYQRTLSELPDATVRATRDSGGPRPRGWSQREAWFEAEGEISELEPGFGNGQLRASVVVAGALQCAISIRLVCVRTMAAYQAWQLDTFDRLREAHASWQRDYEDAIAATEIQTGLKIEGRSPSRNAQTVREELKRQVIEMLVGHSFAGLDLVTIPAEGSTEVGPSTRLADAAAMAPLVQFLEQVFEWNNMSYVLYPYYWATRTRWPELQSIDGADPAYVEFLRSGSARVVVPARPSFETDVLVFADTGMPWSGGPIPLADDEHYISVAREIQELRGAPDEGIPGDLWEVKQPTTLVWLDNDSSLPKENARRRLVGDPLIELCSHPES